MEANRIDHMAFDSGDLDALSEQWQGSQNHVACLIWTLELGQRAVERAHHLCRAGKVVDAVRPILGFLGWVANDEKGYGMSHSVYPIHTTWPDENFLVLGLFYDDAALYHPQLQIWNDVNICCLGICQRQKDITETSIKLNISLPITCLDGPQIEALGIKLIAIGDKLERHGFVDYEMGLWEEEILSGKSSCGISMVWIADYDSAGSMSLAEWITLRKYTQVVRDISTLQLHNRCSFPIQRIRNSWKVSNVIMRVYLRCLLKSRLG
ncbi:hypothetical protein BDV59DRAFT_147331 [Aspergillus ambiguus]|uniref:uncharacterized protein n=1 Tax=Aspergillus ambiguus TaxID=176160 RepID=UPI003CCCE7DA